MNSTQISVRDNWARRDDSNRSWIGESRSGAELWVISTEVMTDSLLKKIIHWCGSSRKKRLEKQTLWAPSPKTELGRKRPKSSEKQMTLQPVNPREVTITRILLVLSQVVWKGQWEKYKAGGQIWLKRWISQNSRIIILRIRTQERLFVFSGYLLPSHCLFLAVFWLPSHTLYLSYGYSEVELGTYRQDLHQEPGPGLQVAMMWKRDATKTAVQNRRVYLSLFLWYLTV